MSHLTIEAAARCQSNSDTSIINYASTNRKPPSLQCPSPSPLTPPSPSPSHIPYISLSLSLRPSPYSLTTPSLSMAEQSRFPGAGRFPRPTQGDWSLARTMGGGHARGLITKRWFPFAQTPWCKRLSARIWEKKPAK